MSNQTMFKLDKKTHLTILFTFAVVFIVIYLYYTIRDVRKVQVDVKKLQDELAVVKTLSTTVGAMKAEIEEMKNTKHVRANIDIANLPAPSTVVSVQEAVQETVQEESVEADVQEEDDVSSVNTDEIRDILDGEDEEEEPHKEDEDDTEVSDEQEGAVEEVDGTPGQTKSPEELKNMKVDELKELCRSYNLSTKGNKNDLLVRVFEHLGMN